MGIIDEALGTQQGSGRGGGIVDEALSKPTTPKRKPISSLSDLVDFATGPTSPATGLRDWATRVVPESAAKFVPRVLQGTYEAVKSQTDPIIKGFTTEFNNPDYNIGREMRTNAANAVKGMGSAALSGLGFGMDDGGNVNWNLENAGRAWSTDPVTAAIGPVAGRQQITSGARAVGRGVAKTGDFVSRNLGPEGLYTSALKMSTGNKLSIPERAARAKTGLEGGYMPTEKGYNKLIDDINSVNGQIGTAIKRAGAEGKLITIDSILSRLDDVKERALNDINPQPILEKIAEIETNLRNHPKAVNGSIPVDVAQKMKIETYRGLKSAYGEMKSAEVEARKSVARGMKEEIAAAVPEISQLNAKDSALINLEKSLEQATKRISNRDIMGIGGPMKVGAGVLADIASGNMGLGTATGLALWALDVPQVKSALAIAMYKAKRSAGKAMPMSKVRAEISAMANRARSQQNQPQE